MAFEQTGKVVEVGKTEVVSDRFKKRKVVLEITKDEKYPNFAEFEFVQKQTDQLDKVQVGDEVTVSFELSGRQYKDKVFNTLRGWRVTGGTRVAGTEPELGKYAEDEIPF